MLAARRADGAMAIRVCLQLPWPRRLQKEEAAQMRASVEIGRLVVRSRRAHTRICLMPILCARFSQSPDALSPHRSGRTA